MPQIVKVANNHVMLSDRAYAWGKSLTLRILPAAGAAYFSLAGLLEWHNGGTVAGVITIVCTFLGAVLGLSSKSYDASGVGTHGDVIITDQPDGARKAIFRPDVDPRDLPDEQDTVTYKIHRRPLRAEGR